MKRASTICTYGSLIAVAAAIAGVVLQPGGVILAQSVGGYEVVAFSLSSGGRSISGGPYILSSATGQPDAGPMSGSNYTLDGGFAPGIGDGDDSSNQTVYLPLILK